MTGSGTDSLYRRFVTRWQSGEGKRGGEGEEKNIVIGRKIYFYFIGTSIISFLLLTLVVFLVNQSFFFYLEINLVISREKTIIG